MSEPTRFDDLLKKLNDFEVLCQDLEVWGETMPEMSDDDMTKLKTILIKMKTVVDNYGYAVEED